MRRLFRHSVELFRHITPEAAVLRILVDEALAARSRKSADHG
jgi:hypothetical protein